MQRVRGLVSFLDELFRFVKLLFLRGAKAVGKQALQTGSHILADIATKEPGQEVSDIVKKRVTQAVEGRGLKRVIKRKRLHSKVISLDADSDEEGDVQL
uniref:Uncharacterized protein n=1 Tax=Timema douglasi TaxID=61478 RepID=A0A7R8Z5A3_TIMDO|nr:unnamed protein product [Timema douglasi]